MCTGGCGGSGGIKSSTPRSSTSRPYTPATPKTIVHRQSMSSGGSTRANSFGTPKIKFSSKGR